MCSTVDHFKVNESNGILIFRLVDISKSVKNLTFLKLNFYTVWKKSFIFISICLACKTKTAKAMSMRLSIVEIYRYDKDSVNISARSVRRFFEILCMFWKMWFPEKRVYMSKYIMHNGNVVSSSIGYACTVQYVFQFFFYKKKKLRWMSWLSLLAICVVLTKSPARPIRESLRRCT